MVNNYSFSKKTAQKQFQIAKQSYEDFLENIHSEDKADKVAEEIWKCTDYFHRENLCNCKFDKLKFCQKHHIDECSSLGAIKDICESSKHSGIDRKTKYLKSSKKVGGAFSESFSQAFDTGGLKVYFENDTEEWFEIIAENSIKYFEKLYQIDLTI